jgi:ribosomal protein S18 acetylase RimI-like enzyme
MSNVVVAEEAITPAEFIEFRELMGAPNVDDETARRTVAGTLYTVCVRENGRLLGFARVVGDGALYFYISDVIVHPVLRGGGHGVRLMNSVLEYLKRTACASAMVVVVPLDGRESFYERFGFKRCPDGHFGAGMYLPGAIRPRAPHSL